MNINRRQIYKRREMGVNKEREVGSEKISETKYVEEQQKRIKGL